MRYHDPTIGHSCCTHLRFFLISPALGGRKSQPSLCECVPGSRCPFGCQPLRQIGRMLTSQRYHLCWAKCPASLPSPEADVSSYVRLHPTLFRPQLVTEMPVHLSFDMTTVDLQCTANLPGAGGPGSSPALLIDIPGAPPGSRPELMDVGRPQECYRRAVLLHESQTPIWRYPQTLPWRPLTLPSVAWPSSLTSRLQI